ncbi:MAG: PrsW family intramembrane metalloprotease [Clostridiales bacterium]|nr:PrsW family intramembrane metalloprotease [Clostridiales bacterium]
MILVILALIISLIPSIALFLWMRNKVYMDNEVFRTLCNRSLKSGAICSFLIMLVSGITFIILAVTKLKEVNIILYDFFYAFIALALMEELVKYFTFNKVLKKNGESYSWIDVVILSSIVAIGFSLMETVVIAIGQGPIVLLIRGISVPHVGYGFIEGYFYGKAKNTGKNYYIFFGFIIAWIVHGLYDFSLSDGLADMYPIFVPIALGLVVFNIVLVVMLITFIHRRRNNEEYTKTL